MYVYKISNLQPNSCTLLESAALGIPQTLKIKSKKPLSKKEVFIHANRYLKEKFNESIEIPVETPKKYKPLVKRRRKLYNENVDFLGLGILVENTANESVIQWVRANFLDTVNELISKKTVNQQGQTVPLYSKGVYINDIVNALIEKYIDSNPDSDLPSRDNIEYFVQQSICDHISFIVSNEEGPVSVNTIADILFDELGIKKDEVQNCIEDMQANEELAFSDNGKQVYKPNTSDDHLAGNSEIADLDITDDIVSDEEAGDYENMAGFSEFGDKEAPEDTSANEPGGNRYDSVYGGDPWRELDRYEQEQNDIKNMLQQKKANALQASRQAAADAAVRDRANENPDKKIPEKPVEQPENAKVKKLSDLANMFMDNL